MNPATIKMILRALEILASAFMIFKPDNGGKKDDGTRSSKTK
ncbi:MAG: hypothetical protein ACOYOS_04500 [Syntrophales bacterium]